MIDYIRAALRESFAPGLNPKITAAGPTVYCKCRRPLADWDGLLAKVNGKVIFVSDDGLLAVILTAAGHQVVIEDPLFEEG